MSDEQAADVPMRHQIAVVAGELSEGWRGHSEPVDRMASHQWGDKVSAEVGRILSAYLSLTHPVLPDREGYWSDPKTFEEAPTLPTGFKLVPVEPTAAMLEAADGWSIVESRLVLAELYRAMIAASPATGEREPSRATDTAVDQGRAT